jgi:hypothetical protein
MLSYVYLEEKFFVCDSIVELSVKAYLMAQRNDRLILKSFNIVVHSAKFVYDRISMKEITKID